jgi:hypothetical protein
MLERATNLVAVSKSDLVYLVVVGCLVRSGMLNDDVVAWLGMRIRKMKRALCV